MTSIESLVLEVTDTTTTDRFYADAFGLGSLLSVRPTTTPTDGFRGFTLSLIMSQPADVHAVIDTAVEAGATTLKPVTKSIWGYGGVVRAPDGAIWKAATSAKNDTGPATRRVDKIALLLGVADVAASRQFYVDHGLTVAKSFGRKYVEFASTGAVTLGLYGRKALAKDAGVPVEGSGSHRITIGGDGGSFTDPDGFAWAAAA